MMDEKKEQLEKVRRAFRDPYLRGMDPLIVELEDFSGRSAAFFTP